MAIKTRNQPSSVRRAKSGNASVFRHSRILSERGAVSLLLVSVSVILVIASLSASLSLKRWAQRVDLQLTLDECVEKPAIRLRSLLKTGETSNQRMNRLRQAIVITPEPGAQGALRAALLAENMLMLANSLQWKMVTLHWLARKGCGYRVPLAPFPWTQLPPDALGPRPWPWSGPAERRFCVRSRDGLEEASALIERKTNGFSKSWNARWSRCDSAQTGLRAS